MLDQFLSYLAENQMTGEGQKTLVAASAGVDSSVLCHLYHRAGLPFAIAHCNFRLRDMESDEDEVFMENLAGQLGVECHVARFDTKSYAHKNKMSIQLAARELRYRWLERIRMQSDCMWIATAHHVDDNIETVLYNFTKGCGIRGMRGILPVNGSIIRPLLFTGKDEISSYAKSEGISYREDSSNLSDKYTRNRIRQQVTPALEAINPSFRQSAGGTIRRMQEVEALYHFAVQLVRQQVLQKSAGRQEWKIDVRKLLTYPAPGSVLYELLEPFGFNNSQTAQILQSTDNQPGSYFSSSEYRLVSDRSYIILQLKENIEGVKQIAGIHDAPIQLPEGRLEMELIDNNLQDYPSGADIAMLDYDKLQWPLTLRHWQHGDVFQPLGMGGKRKKIQDFFTDRKLSLFEKEAVWLLESAGAICWVVGMRIDERFKITKSTRRCLVLSWQ